MTFTKEIACPRCDNRFRPRSIAQPCAPAALPCWCVTISRKQPPRSPEPPFETRAPTLWRYREVLPLNDDANRVSLGEGFTPLLEAKTLARELGLRRLWIKDEAQNPTGSFKDRGLSMAISTAKELGVTKTAIPSAGNAGGSLSAYAARAGIEAYVFMPKDTPLANQIETRQYGARLTLVDGSSTTAAGLSPKEKQPKAGLMFRP